jgi:hypothetical protein
MHARCWYSALLLYGKVNYTYEIYSAEENKQVIPLSACIYSRYYRPNTKSTMWHSSRRDRRHTAEYNTVQ